MYQNIYHAAAGLCLDNKDEDITATISGLLPIMLEDNGRSFSALTTENITQFRFQKVSKLPKECGQTATANMDPIANFEATWKQFDTHYAFFEARKINWKDVYARYRPKVTPQTTANELYLILSNMLGELNDRHVILDDETGKEFRGGLGSVVGPWFESYARNQKGAENAIDYINAKMSPYKALVVDNYMDGSTGTAGQGQILWGRLKGNIGYIRLDSFSSFDARDGYKYHKAALDAAIDAALLDTKGVKAFIIDMRFNLGGNDGLGLALMSRFADQKRLAYTKQAQATVGFTALQKISVVPSPHRFGGKVAILIGNVTVSAGENFTIASLPFANVIRVGETTAGALSDVLMKPLPNGWEIGISNEIFRTADGRDIEAIGIKPDVAVPNHFAPQTLSIKRDIILETAMSKLKP